jgi:hypothetical protein
MQNFEFRAHYRTRRDLEPILTRLGWGSIDWNHDEVGLQTFVRAVKA